jgi:hypothetical protein
MVLMTMVAVEASLEAWGKDQLMAPAAPAKPMRVSAPKLTIGVAVVLLAF